MGMNYLVAIDGSDASETALDHACTLAERTGGTVTLVHAVNPSVYSDTRAPEEEERLVQNVEQAEERGEELLAAAREHAEDRGVSVAGSQLLYGEPTAAIPEFATDGDFDGIVVGHRGLSDRYERVLGSVAKGLIGGTTIPVTVVRTEFTAAGE
jgi:nucleotide-binding universal stress UspA family protein